MLNHMAKLLRCNFLEMMELDEGLTSKKEDDIYHLESTINRDAVML